MEKLFTRKEAAELLGISITTLDAARNNGLIAYVQFPMAAFSLPAPVSRNTLPNVRTEQSLWRRKRPTAMCGRTIGTTDAQLPAPALP